MITKIQPTGYRDRRVLDHFITAQGKIRAKRLTKVSTKQHRAITKAIKKSRILARLPFMLSGILERKIYAEELLDSSKVVRSQAASLPDPKFPGPSGKLKGIYTWKSLSSTEALDLGKPWALANEQPKPGALASPRPWSCASSLELSNYTQGAYPVTKVNVKIPSLKRKITRRTRIRTFAQVRVGLREDIRNQYIRINKNLRKGRRPGLRALERS